MNRSLTVAALIAVVRFRITGGARPLSSSA